MAVTQGAAICWPSLPQNSLMLLATAVASRLWPQASWKITPPKPLPMTTGITPEGQKGAWSIFTAVLPARRPIRAGSMVSRK